MNHQPKPDRSFFHFMLRAQQLARQDARSDQGYAMMMTSLIAIALFSLLAAYFTLTNLSKSSTDAYIDGTSTFYAAESGLNRRAEQLRQKFIGYATPTGTATYTAASLLPTCVSVAVNAAIDPANDFECRNYSFTYNNNITQVTSGGNTVLSEQDGGRNRINYTAYTFVKPERDYTTTPPATTVIPAGQTYAGLNALEYRYTVYSTAAKPDPNSPTSAIQQTGGQTVLQMDFRSRIVPLFQFAAFYEDDLEMDSQMPMSVSGPIHTNGDLMPMSYSINQDPSVSGKVAYPSLTFSDANVMAGTRLLGKVTAAGDIYGGVAAQTWMPGGCGTSNNCGVMSVYKGSGSLTSKDNYHYFPDKTFNQTTTPKLTAAQMGVFGDRMKDKNGGVKRLSPPKPGFLREQNYKTGETGLYYGKADMRIKFYPNRAMPFDFISIQNGSGCSLTTYNIPSDRQGSSTLTCSQLTKGQLRSLQQPVLFVPTTAAPAPLTPNDKILKALKVAIASSPTILTLNDLNNLPIPSATGTWGKTFRDILAANSLPASSPTQTAKQRVEAISTSISFLPPPIQIVSGTTPSTDLNMNGSFYNQLKGVWMTMLQTNIRSLTYWNGFGIYVESTAPTILTSGYSPGATPTIVSGLSTNELVFKRKAADTSNVDLVGSFLHQGLAAEDLTEGGLVLYASVSDDLNGDGTTTSTEIVASNTINNGLIPGKDDNGNIIPDVDYYRKYSGDGGVKRKSPYAFVVSGGSELPGPLTIATDQAAYIQGDYNNPNVTPGSLVAGTPYVPSNSLLGDATATPPIVGSVLGFYRQPAAIMADTITILSNECVNNNGRIGRVSTAALGTVNCGSDTVGIGSGKQVTNGIAINAAFLSNLMKSGTRNADGSYTVTALNGGLNKYMRLLENWGGSTAGTHYNYSGSMVSLGEPLESGEVPSGSGVPKRNFNFEPRFSTFNGLPPLTPSAIYLQQDVFKRTY